MNESAIYLGRLTHRRYRPKPHAFSYPLYMLYLDLDQLSALPPSPWFGIEKARPLSFRRRDYLGRSSRPLKDEVLDEVERTLGFRPGGPVGLLTQVRAFGYVFNPVSFYYCLDADGQTVAAVVAEITNTPWGERHRYVLRAERRGAKARFAKAFHVSPFFPMAQTYDWTLSEPGERLTVGMANEEDGQTVFRAQLTLLRRPFSSRQLLTLALGLPLLAWRVHAAIYAQAFRLWLKGAPFFSHPAALPSDEPRPPR
jgi:uncharacterized protein